MKNKSISMPVKISILISSLIVSVMIIANLIVYYTTYDKMLSNNKESMNIVSNEIYKNFQNLIKLQTNDIDKAALDNDILRLAMARDMVTRAEFQKSNEVEIKTIGEKLKRFSNDAEFDEHVFMTDSTGVIIADSNKEYLNIDLGQFDFAKKALTGQVVMSEVYTSTITSRPIVTFLKPIRDEKGFVVGLVGKSVFTEYFSKQFEKFSFLNSGFVFIVDSSQNVIYHPNKYYINKKVDIDQIRKISMDVKTVNDKKSGSIRYKSKNNEYEAIYTSVPEIKSLIVLSIEVREIKAQSKVLGLIILMVTIVMISIVIPTLYIIIKKILSPLNKLIRNTEEMAKGNLTVINEVKSKDEIGRLSESFNLMMENIKYLLLETKEVIEDLVNINNIINTSQENIAASMNLMDGSSRAVFNNTNKVDEAIKWIFISFSTVVDKIKHIKLQSEDVFDRANKIKKINIEGINTITHLKGINEESLEKLNLVNESFSNLTGHLSSIKQIADAVTEISNQTHILSLNASIEAARAGEYGKGFNVVAMEIKKLSQNIVVQMGNIDSIIKGLNVDMNGTEKNINIVNSIFLNQMDVVETTISNFNEILSSTEDIADFIKQVNTSIESLSNENNKIIKSVNEVKGMSSEFKDSVLEISNVIEEQYQESESMNRLVERLELTTSELKSNINKFSM